MASAYTYEQIEVYEQHISLPEKYRRKNNPPLNIDYLTTLHTHQISTCPYENLILHYSPEHTVYLEPQKLFTKIIDNARGRGGYCMELSIFYNHVLRALGFQVYTAGVRVRARLEGIPQGNYHGWFHIVNIVTLPNSTQWMVDVGFGGDGPTKPVPMISGTVLQNLGTQEIRLLYSTIPEQVDKSKKLWIYQYRNRADHDWNSFYCFHEIEFLESDFEIINYYTSTCPAKVNFQVTTVVVVMFVRGEVDGEEKIVGKRYLVNGIVKENMGGKTKIVRECTTEEERIRVLKEYFGIILTGEEKDAVRGRNVELPMTLPL